MSDMDDVAAHFPNNYREARAAFLHACADSGSGVTSRLNPRRAGEDGKPLFLDTAVIGNKTATKALLLISATHGVEGYFGSGAQTGFLRNGLARRALRNARIVLVHALNPFGFSFDRRVNEDNIDVNRNFVDHAHPPVNAGYDALADDIAPKDISPDGMRRADARLDAWEAEHGNRSLQEAISRGQYRYPDGVFFGGSNACWSASALKDVFREELAHVEQLIVIDFHTGLGKSGDAEMITEDLPGSAGYRRAKSMWGGLVCSSEAGESLSAPLTGTIDHGVAAWMKGKQLIFAALEVGTAPLKTTFQAIRKDNWLHTRASPDHPLAKQIRQEMRAAFYPDTAEWKTKVFAHAQRTVHQACTNFA